MSVALRKIFLRATEIAFGAEDAANTLVYLKTAEPDVQAINRHLMLAEKSFKAAFEAIEQEAACTKHETALHIMGLCYANGKGVAFDMVKATHYFSLAAKKGYGQAQYNLAHCYLKGEGVPKNLLEAAKYYSAAAAQEVPGAKCFLAQVYGKLMQEATNIKDAEKYYRLTLAHFCSTLDECAAADSTYE